jgi:hypothetical protein
MAVSFSAGCQKSIEGYRVRSMKAKGAKMAKEAKNLLK